MKKKLLYTITLLAALVACTKEVIDEREYNTQAPVQQLTEDGTMVELTARIAPSTKVDFDSELGRFSWSEMGDEISVHVTNGTRLVEGEEVVMSPAGYRKGVVAPASEGDIVLDDDQNEIRKFYFVLSEGQQRDYYAVYPASAVDEENYGNPDLKINLPASYEISPEGMGDYSPTPMIAVNDPSSTYLDFRHVGGLLRLSLYDVSPSTASFEVSVGKRITGSFTVNDPEDPETAVPYIVTDDAADVVTFTLTEPLTEYKDGLVLNVPVPTGVYESLTVTAKDSGGNSIFSYEDSKRRMFDSSRGRQAQAIVSSVAIPLCLEAIEDGAVIIENPLGLTIEYSYDNIFWTAASDATVTIPAAEGTCVYLRGDNPTYAPITDYDDTNQLLYLLVSYLYPALIDDAPEGTHISTDGSFYIYGNIMSLVDALHFDERTDLTAPATFAGLFTSDEGLYNHPDKGLELPATTITALCYVGLFSGCSNITRASALPATVLQPACYVAMYGATGITRGVEILADEIPDYACISMYAECTSLTAVPDMKASVVGGMACSGMFSKCISLVSAPALPAATVGASGYSSMFDNCIALTTPPVLGATTIGESAFESMFKGCASLTSAPSMSAIASLPKSACRDMFYGCSSLIEAPAMAAETVDEYSCKEMFMNCSSLTVAPSLPASSIPEYAYDSMFRGCVSLAKAPALPATTLADYAYMNMFYDCSSLTDAPALPAPTVGVSTYYNMFYRCTALEEPPVISATTLATSCYSQMFYGCTSLLVAPALPVTTLASSCYRGMFEGCTSLTESPILPAENLVAGCYKRMFYNCTNLNRVTMLGLNKLIRRVQSGYFSYPYWDYSEEWLTNVQTSGTFVKNPEATSNYGSDRGKSTIPSGWTIIDATE